MEFEDLKKVLKRDDLVPEEWARHSNGGGWYEVAGVDIDESVYLAPGAVVVGRSRLRCASVEQGCRVFDSNIADTAVRYYSLVRRSTIDHAILDEADVENSQVDDSFLHDSRLIRCVVKDHSTIINANATDTVISESMVEDSMAIGSRIEKLSKVDGASLVENCRVFNTILNNAAAKNKNLRYGQEVPPENPWGAALRGNELYSLPGGQQVDRAIGAGEGAGALQ